MAVYPNVKMKRGRTANETIILFHGSTIGTIMRFAYPKRRKCGVKWAIHTHDDHQHLGWCSDRRESAIRRLVHRYLAVTGSDSGRHNSWVSRVKTRLEGDSK